jgi:hypothetical protein
VAPVGYTYSISGFHYCAIANRIPGRPMHFYAVYSPHYNSSANAPRRMLALTILQLIRLKGFVRPRALLHRELTFNAVAIIGWIELEGIGPVYMRNMLACNRVYMFYVGYQHQTRVSGLLPLISGT